jgi:formate hydrogenlyase subunit 3/multisubunit Na+/H+ antiporter MnhD subunit
LGRSKYGSEFIYGACLAVALAILAIGVNSLITNGTEISAVTLPLGVPWIGARFRLDALSAYFLVIVNLGAAGASLYGIGYGKHESVPLRVLPFFAAFLAGMNLVVMADGRL